MVEDKTGHCMRDRKGACRKGKLIVYLVEKLNRHWLLGVQVRV